MQILPVLTLLSSTLANFDPTIASASQSAAELNGPRTPFNIIYANTVIINVTKSAHADGPPKKKPSGLKTKIGLSMFRAAADTYLEEKARQDDRKKY